MPKKVCPVLMQAVANRGTIQPDNIRKDLTRCIEDKCAWWCNQAEACALINLGNIVHVINGK